MLQQMNLSTFSGLLQTQFGAYLTPEQRVDLVLIEAEDLGSTPRQEQFSLQFQGPLTHFLPQATYPVEHATLGQFALFLVPVGREPEGYRYEAIFNLLVDGR